MSERGLFWTFLAALVIAVAVAWWEWPQASLTVPERASQPNTSKRAEVFALVGTPSCSARACHGGAGSERELHQDEYTKWLTYDRHANAYQVLKEERSTQIAKHLGLKKPAYEETLCLACHTNPLVVGDAAERTLQQHPDSKEAMATRGEKFFGVGCESCHGPAAKWLAPHTEPGWSREIEKRLAENPQTETFGYKPMRNPQMKAKVCVECHVGAPANKNSGVPVRDVNHDLIAAGHPRMDFEIGAFLANMAPHWNEDNWIRRRSTGTEIDEWLVGQLVSAEAALELLADRADPGSKRPWPEFAEYDCFACHHNLHDPSWRQSRGYPHRSPGSLPWGTWYLSMPKAISAMPPFTNREIATQLNVLNETMANPFVDRGKARSQAITTAETLRIWKSVITATKLDQQKLRDLLLAVSEAPPISFELSPQSAEQLYQAAVVLSLAKGDKDFFRMNADLGKLRHCPVGFDGPPAFNPTLFQTELVKYLKR